MKPVVAVLGEPATGKSALVRELLAGLPEPYPDTLGTCRFLRLPGLVVLGRYPPEEPHPGTDRLGMAVLPDALRLLAARSPDEPPLLFEGDRLAVRPFLAAARAAGPLVVLRLVADPATLAARHADRGDRQAPAFLKGRRTKLDRLAAEFPPLVLLNRSSADLRRNLEILRALLRIGDRP